MKKDTLTEIILGTIGGLVFAIGMCMCLVSEWDLFLCGVVVAIIGFIILLCIIPVFRKNHPKKAHEPINIRILIAWIIGIIGSLVMGFGMSMVMCEDPSRLNLIIGITTGIVGLIVCVLNYPIYAYLESK